MTTNEIILWSMAAGACATSVFVLVLDVVVNKHWDWRSEGASYQLSALLWLFFISGLAHEMWPREQYDWVRMGEILIGPLVAALGSYRMRFWYATRGKDPALDQALRWVPVLVLVFGVAVFWLPEHDQLYGGILVAMVSGVGIIWATRRAYWLPTRQALAMQWAAMAFVVVIACMYYNFTVQRLPEWMQLLMGLLYALTMAVTSSLVWSRNALRNYIAQRKRQLHNADPVTGVLNGVSIVQAVDAFQRTHQAGPRPAALISIILENTPDLQPELGYIGADVLYSQIAAMIKTRASGGMHTVGRYFDRCFLVLVENASEGQQIRRRCLTLARELAQPMAVRIANGQQKVVTLEYGVGLLLFDASPFDTEVALDRAQDLALTASRMTSHCAVQTLHMGRPTASQSAPAMLSEAGTGIDGAPVSLEGGQ